MGVFRVHMCPTRNGKLQKLLLSEAVKAEKGFEGILVDKDLKERLPIIYCECGAEILLLPDLHAMNLAIKNHVNEHQKKARTEKRKIINFSSINQLLSQLLFRKIIEQNDN